MFNINTVGECQSIHIKDCFRLIIWIILRLMMKRKCLVWKMSCELLLFEILIWCFHAVDIIIHSCILAIVSYKNTNFPILQMGWKTILFFIFLNILHLSYCYMQFHSTIKKNNYFDNNISISILFVFTTHQ